MYEEFESFNPIVPIIVISVLCLSELDIQCQVEKVYEDLGGMQNGLLSNSAV